MEDFIGSAAAILTTVSFLPQAITTLKTKDTSGLSLGMYICFVTGVFLWMIYGLAIQDAPIFIANIITLALASTILAVIIKNSKVTKAKSYAENSDKY